MENQTSRLQHEDEETYTLRTLYQDAVMESHPDLNEDVAFLIACMVVKKARYGVRYEPEIERLIEEINEQIKKYYSTET